MPKKIDQVFDSRKDQGKLERELVYGGVVIGLVVGGGLITLIWGVPALFVVLMIFLGFWVLVGIIWGFLKLLEMVTRD